MQDTPLIKVLYIDDEEQNLQSFKANFRRNFKTFITTSTDEAVDLIEKEDIGVVIADHKMPGKTGVEFFEEIRPRFPDSVRILLTAYTDINAAISAINKGEVFRFIDKPWDAEFVVNAIEDAYEIFNTRRQLKLKNAALKKATEELDHFVYSASHDLRAPLMSILGIINLAETEPLSAEVAQYFELIQQSVVKLDSFIINIIDYYRNSRNASVIKSIDFQEAVADTQQTLRYLPQYSKVHFNIHIEQECAFYSDVVKWRIILNNLLSNAIKFYDPQKVDSWITVDIRVIEEKCVLKVEDNGKGIDKDSMANIFQMFYRGGSIGAGSGVGLYVVEEAVNKLNGTITVKSEEKKGTTFEITVPQNKVDEP